MRCWHFFFFVAILALFVPPALAGTLYISGGPDISAGIAGTNEFAPGSIAKVNAVVENRGLIDLKIVRSDVVSRDDLPSTAKMVRVTLLADNAPLTVKSDPQMIGDIAGGATETVAFDVKIDDLAPGGTFTSILRVEYTYLYTAESEGQDNIRYYYKTVTKDIPLTINIRPTVQLSVMGVTTEHLDVGAEGYLILVLKNIGDVDARDAVARISQNGQSPVKPTDSSVYLGNFSAGDEVDTRFKAAVSSSAADYQVYPLDVYIEYQDFEGNAVITDPVTFGVPIGGKIEFSVVSPPEKIVPGEKTVIEVEYKNTGSAEVFRAQARLSAVDPFTSSDDTAFLGDLKPGQSAIARYDLSADAAATVKIYGLDSEIRYRDALDNPQISKTMKVEIEMTDRPGLMSSLSSPLVLIVILVAIAGAGYYIVKVRRKDR